jgi:hypothetical protein
VHGQREACDRTGVLTTDQAAPSPAPGNEEAPNEGPGRPMRDRFSERLEALSIKRNSEVLRALQGNSCAAGATNGLVVAQIMANCVEALRRTCTWRQFIWDCHIEDRSCSAVGAKRRNGSEQVNIRQQQLQSHSPRRYSRPSSHARSGLGAPHEQCSQVPYTGGAQHSVCMLTRARWCARWCAEELQGPMSDVNDHAFARHHDEDSVRSSEEGISRTGR